MMESYKHLQAADMPRVGFVSLPCRDYHSMVTNGILIGR